MELNERSWKSGGMEKKVEAFLHVRDDRLRRRELQSSFVQKLLYEELDFSFQ